MAQDFYDILNVTSNASSEDIRNAFRLRTAKLVKRLKNAKEKDADTTVLRDTFKRLKAAKNILIDPMRRKSYDVFRESIEHGVPNDIDVFWSTLQPSMIEPKLSAALKVLQQFT
jgi:DnaJ-class molecular chaperone